MRSWILAIMTIILLAGCAPARENQVQIFIQTPVTGYNGEVYNIHDHLAPGGEVPLLEAMHQANITKMALLGSPDATLYGNTTNFTGYDQNNADLLALAKANPALVVFCTISPTDPEKLAKLQMCTRNGARGLKLYSGDPRAYTIPLNASEMTPIYEYVTRQNLPVMWHMTIANDTLYNQFDDVLTKFPAMHVVVPHLGVNTNLTRLGLMLDKHSNLSTDVSFGTGLNIYLRIVSKRHDAYRDFIMKYQDRVLFGTDLVAHGDDNSDWMYNVTMCYRHMLEQESYDCVIAPIPDSGYPGMNETLHGLALPPDVLRKIYLENPRRLLNESTRAE